MDACILGTKIGMTSLYDENGTLVPVTVVKADPCVVVQRKTVERDGYSAVQVGGVAARLRKPLAGKKPKQPLKRHGLNKPQAGHLAKAGVEPVKYLREFRVPADEEIPVGHQLTVEQFSEGDVLAVTGTSKGKGFAGAVKRWHFHGADMTHGSMIHRKPQSGGATDPARTFKGVKRPGRMGGERVTVRSVKVFGVDPERSLLLLKGPVPGANGGLLTIKRLKAGKGAG
ncbi:MAG: 50S ribosomal protein L3 [Armatimonadota bacterium]|nr:MAG: 50S ribosomal protein L3 [Armatimonadota bacterium]